MATKLHLRCIACGSLRSFSTFFGDHDFENDFDFDVGGVPHHELHDRYILALKQIEDDVNAARLEAGLPLLTWNRENP